MTKRRKISEIFEEIQKINNRKPNKKDLEELAKILNKTKDNNENQ